MARSVAGSPDEPTILLALGEALEQNQQPIQALDYYGQVLQQDPANRAANLGRARILFAQQNYQEAEQVLRRVLEHAPADPAAHLALVDVLVASGRRAEAELILRDLTAGQLEPKYFRRLAELLIELGQFEQASNYYKAILHNNPNDRQGTKGLALVYAREQRYGDAVHILAQYLRDNPNDDDLREYAAQLSENADQWDVAEQHWQMLIRAHPENSTWKIRLARLMDKAGRPEEGLAIAQDILSKEPHNTDALGLLADHAIYSGNKQEAVQWLERLTELVSDYDRSIQLANLHIDLGNSFADIGQQDQARAEYTMALQAYRVAHKLRPTSTDAHLGQLDARRLLGDTKQVIEETNQLLKTYPQLELLHDLSYTLYSEQSDYAHANQALSELRKQFPNNLNRELLYAELLFDSGRAGHAFDLTNKLSQAAIRPAVPVLLYHGISPSAYADAMPLAQFRDQLTALKKEGYQTITIHQLYRFLQGEDKALPAKPILVTFDDARDDSFRYADPVLEETGFRATMFVPTAEVGHHGLYNAFWPTIRRLQQTDRWDMQCHGDHGHRLIPIDAQGHMARFLVNQMWLTDQRRLENEQEFLNRVENDYRQCKEILSREVPGSQVIAYAYPFGDLGQKTFNNQPTALAANKRLVMKYYPMAFLQEELGFATRAIPRFALARFEVPREFSGRDLVEKLKFDPEASIAYLRGRFYADSGNYEQAMKIFQSLEQDRGIKSPNLLLEEAKVLTWSGDYAAARAHLLQAQAIRPDDPQIIRQFNRYQRQVSPMVQIDGSTYKDNQDRSNFQVGTFGQLHLTDRVALSATYHYAEFEDVSRGALPPSELSVNNQGLPNTRLHVSGHEVTGGFDYSVDNRTSLSLTGGFADFNGNTSQQFPLGSAAARLPLGEAIDIAVGATHSYVNTAGAILTGLAYTGINGDLKGKFLRDDLTLSLRHTFTHYDDGNNRNTTTVDGLRRVWLEPDIKVGYQFTYDDTEKQNPLFYTPDRFMAHEAIASIRKSFGDGFTVGGLASLGAGKEGDGGFQFQVSVGGDIRFEVANGLGLVAEANRSQAASFDSFYTFAGVYWRF